MDSYRPGDVYHGLANTYGSDGSSADADPLPTAKLRRNGAIDGSVSVTVTHDTNSGVQPGTYPCSATIPSNYSSGDVIHIVVTAIVSGITASWVLDQFVLDSARNSDLLAEMQSFGQDLRVNDSSATANSFIVAGLPSNATLNAYVGNFVGVFMGSGDAVGQSALITASTAGPNVRLTLGSGLTAPPSNGSILLMIDPPT